MGSFKQRFKSLTQRSKKDRGINGAHLPATAQSNVSNPSGDSITENHVQSSGRAGDLDKISKPASMNCSATTVSGLPDSPQPKKNIPNSSSADATPTLLSDSNDPWALAYVILQKREPKLVECYQTHLRLAQRNSSVNSADAADADLSNPRSVESTMTRLLENREQKQWKVSLLGKDVKIREQTEKLAKFLLWADPVVKNAVSTQPYAALAWAGVSLLLPLLSGSTTANLAMLKGFDSIDNVQIYWDICEKRYLQSEHMKEYRDLIKPLATLYSFIIEYQARAICHLSETQISRAWKNIAGENDWDGMKSKIERSSEDCSSYLPHLELGEIRNHRDRQLKEIKESRSILDEICNVLKEDTSRNQKNYEDRNERRLLETLASDYEDDKNYNPLRVPGTCEWFFEGNDFRNWRDSDTSSLLWISAGPGCGKSVLSRTLIDENRLSTNITTSRICYFFFKDGDERRVSATDALCALLHQLFTHDPTGTLIQDAVTSHKNHGGNLARNFSELWRLFIQCVGSPELGEVVCVLDALDECKSDSMRQFLGNLKEFYSNPQPLSATSKLKLLFTSRPYDNLEVSFHDFPDTTALLHFDGDDKSAEISKDIDLVIDAKLQKVTRNFKERDRQMIAKEIKDKKNRTYLWLHLTFDIIEQSPSEYSRRSDIKGLLSVLPSEVSDAYEKILDRSKNELHTKTLLEIVLAATRPLSLDEANIALTMALGKDGFESHDDLEADLWAPEDFKSVVKNLCGLFINVFDSKLFFIHLTAREFLTDRLPSGKWKGRLNMTQSHATMAVLCLSYLPHIDWKGSAEETREEFLLAEYSARHWIDHCRPAETEDKVLESVLRFFLEQSEVYTIWLNLFDPDKPRREEPLDYRDYKIGTPLYYSSLLGLQRIAEVLLAEGADVNAPGGKRGNALNGALDKGQEGIAHLLLANGADIHVPADEFHGTALQYASLEGARGIVELLLAKNVDVNALGSPLNALQCASVGGQVDVAELLLAKGAEINTPSEYGTALRLASLRGHEGVVRLLLANGADVNAPSGEWDSELDKGSDYGTALEDASCTGDEGIVQLLLANGADINAPFGPHGTALQQASANGHEGLVQLLLANGADIEAPGPDYYGNALQQASHAGQEGIVQLLLAKGADVNAPFGPYGTALQRASGAGHEGIVQLLSEKGAEINAPGGDYNGTALQAASAGGHERIVHLLLANGADVNAPGPAFNATALHRASAGGHEEVVHLLIAKGADINASGTTRYSETALQRASADGHEGVIQLLLANGADVNAPGEGGTPLQIASRAGHEEIVQLLLANGADINAPGGELEGTALQAASAMGHERVVQLLLANGADTNAPGGEYHGTALQRASAEGHERIVQLLLVNGADINAPGGEYYGTALQRASANGHESVVQLLLANGADVNAPGPAFDGTALQLASDRGHEGVMRLLLAKGARDINAQGQYVNEIQQIGPDSDLNP
ncbi:hypothetical protein PCG10_002003 [Penicillium crustosum]|uniref:NWD NACHT-NTPase N-terminal domain-containing protein n=2 Tax=Penicillium crustosum TaxID=36656 RepID=A0A9P5KVG9_PENCR|nr:hypothetical protein PCG10_002003 [Penicillium crustosum]